MPLIVLWLFFSRINSKVGPSTQRLIPGLRALPVDRNSRLSRRSEAFISGFVHAELCANVGIVDHIGALVLTVLEFFGVPH